MRNLPDGIPVSVVLALIVMAYFSSSASADSDERTCYINIDPHPCMAVEENPIKACTKAVEDDPYDMQARLTLCGAHLHDSDNEENRIDAYIVVKKGIELCGSDGYVCQRFKYAKSMIEESDEGGGRQQVISARERCDYGRDLCLSRLTSSLGLRGCDLALICDSDNPALYAGKGKKLLARDRPAEAVAAFSNAARLDPDSAQIRAQLADARQARATLAAVCLKGDSIDICNAALLAGEPDEFDVQYRRGQLLLVEGRQPAALQAFMHAQTANLDNEALARELLEVLDSAIRESPDEVDYRRAQGFALLAVGSTNDSIRTFRKALELNPDDREIVRGLAAARADRSQKVKRDCLSGIDLKACDAMLLAGEPDEARIREHKARLLLDENDLDAALAEAKTVARLEPGNVAVSAIIAEIAAQQAPRTPEPEPERDDVVVALAEPEPDSESEQTDVPDVSADPVDAIPAPAIYSNAAREDGRTY